MAKLDAMTEWLRSPAGREYRKKVKSFIKTEWRKRPDGRRYKHRSFRSPEAERESHALWLKSPAGREFRSDMRRITEPTLTNAKKHYDEKGYCEDFWEAILFCLNDSVPVAMPEWLRAALKSYASAQIKGLPVKRRKRSPEYNRDSVIFFCVNQYRKERRPFGKQGKLRRYSWFECFKRFQEEHRESTARPGQPGEFIPLDTIEKAYKRAAKRFPRLL